MPFEIRARNGGKLVLIRHSGAVDCQEITDAVADINRIKDPDNPPRLLVDVRAADSMPGKEALLNWFWHHSGEAPEIRRVAMVMGDAHNETIEAIVAAHESLGTAARTFDDELEALTWVMRTRDDARKSRNGIAFDKLASVRVFVSDLERARDFYAGQLGLGLLEQAGNGGALLYALKNASLLIERIDQSDERFDRLVGRVTGISFRVKDIDGAFVRLTSQGLKFCSEPKLHESGQRSVDFLDPDDNVLTLVN